MPYDINAPLILCYCVINACSRLRSKDVRAHLPELCTSLRRLQTTALEAADDAQGDFDKFLRMLRMRKQTGSRKGSKSAVRSADAFFAVVCPLLHPDGVGPYSLRVLKKQYELYSSQENECAGNDVALVVRRCSSVAPAPVTDKDFFGK
jgi:hypothetical protein